MCTHPHLDHPAGYIGYCAGYFAISLSLNGETCIPFINLDNSLARPLR